MKKVLFVASVVKVHIMVFHIPYLKWFKENGYEVHVAAKNDYLEKTELNIPYCDVFYDVDFSRQPFSKNNINAYVQMKKIIENEDFELMHCHTPIGAAIARLAAKNSKSENLKVIYTAHGFHFYKGAPLLNWLIYFPLEYYLSKYTDVIMTINEEDYNMSLKMKAKDNIMVPGIGFDFSMIKEIKAAEENIVNKDIITMVSVGELNKNKNHKIVIENLTKLENQNYQYLICGEGPEQQNLQNLVLKYNLTEKVHFLGFRKDVLKIVNKADIFVFPSYREGLSVSLMESMAFGLPVVASNIRGNRDLIDVNKGGYLFEPNNGDELVFKLQKLINNKKNREMFGEYNQRKVRKYSIENAINAVTKVYNKLLKSKYLDV